MSSHQARPESYILLNRMIEGGVSYDTFLSGDDRYLEPLLTDLAAQDLVRITGSFYQVTHKGREEYEAWMRRYYDWIPRLEVFSAVDLAAGEFAFARYFDFQDDRSWEDYLRQSRFQDVRLAVCEYHRLSLEDREEIVFMSFLNQGRWGDLENTPGWQFDLGSGKVLEEVKAITKDAIAVEHLGYESPEGYISGEKVIEDIVRQGEELTLKLWEKEKKSQGGSHRGNSSGETSGKLEKETGLDDAYRL